MVRCMPVINSATATKELVGGIVLNGPVDLPVSEIIEPLEEQSTKMDAQLELGVIALFPRF